MNIHPLLAHFPIALLTVYALIEIIFCFLPAKFKKTDWLLTLRTFLVIAGFMTLFPTLSAGEFAESIKPASAHNLIEHHEFFAQLTTIIFGLLAGGYTLWLFDAQGWSEKLTEKSKLIAFIFTWGRKLADIIMHPFVRPTLAVFGLITITITGALGAALAHGPHTDFIVSFIYDAIM